MDNIQKPVNFMYFWLNYCDKNHIERIPVAVKNYRHLFNLAREKIDADNLHLFLLFDGTRIDNNEYLSSLENGTELIVCTEEQIQNACPHRVFLSQLARGFEPLMFQLKNLWHNVLPLCQSTTKYR